MAMAVKEAHAKTYEYFYHKEIKPRLKAAQANIYEYAASGKDQLFFRKFKHEQMAHAQRAATYLNLKKDLGCLAKVHLFKEEKTPWYSMNGDGRSGVETKPAFCTINFHWSEKDLDELSHMRHVK
jgi:hypothetical protein